MIYSERIESDVEHYKSCLRDLLWLKMIGLSALSMALKACGVDNEYVVKNTTKEGYSFQQEFSSLQHLSSVYIFHGSPTLHFE